MPGSSSAADESESLLDPDEMSPRQRKWWRQSFVQEQAFCSEMMAKYPPGSRGYVYALRKLAEGAKLLRELDDEHG